jgi:hypothetical protein
MKHPLYKYVLFILVILGVFIACQQEETYPIIPEIEFDGFIKLWNPQTMVYDRGVFAISFKDGDGDIGLEDGDTIPPYDFNLFINYYELQNGDSVRVVISDSNEFNARIPVLTPIGTNKSISGLIEDTLFMYNYQSTFDTIMFDAYIMDRALHKSNVVNTGWFLRN